MNPYDNAQPWRDSVGRGRQRTLPAWMATPSLDRSSTISGISAPPWNDSNGIARGRQRTLPAWMTTPMQISAIPPPPPPYETYHTWNSRHHHTLPPVLPPPPPPPPLPTQPFMVYPQQTSLPSFWQLSNEQKRPLPAPPSQYSIPYGFSSAFMNLPSTSRSGSDERADMVMIPDSHRLENIAPINDLLRRNAHKDANSIKIHHNKDDSNALFSSLNLDYESGMSSKNKSDSFLNKERASDHPYVSTSATAATATRTNNEEEDDMDIEESDIEHEVSIDFIGGGDFDNLLSNTRVSRRKKIQVLWTRTIQFASSFPDEIPNSIRNPLLELAAKTRKQGHLMKLLPEQRRPFLEYCVKTVKVSPKLAGDIFSFLESKRVSEFRWKKALESYEISLCDDTVVQEIVSRLKSLAQKGLLCPRNKVDFLYFCDCCFPPISVETCDQVYDFLVSHIPEFSAFVVRRPWDCMSSMHEKITMLPNWSQNEKMLFVIEHVVADELEFFCPFRSLLLALQSQLKQFSESIFSYRGVSNRKKFFKYCKEKFTGMAEMDVRRAFQFISKKIKEYESQALRENVSHDKSDQSDEPDSSEIMPKTGQRRKTSNVISDQGDQQAQMFSPNSLALSRLSKLSAISMDLSVRNKQLFSEMAGLSGSKDSSINTGVDTIKCQSACTNTFKATPAIAEENYEFSLFRHSDESGKHDLSTTQQLGKDDKDVPEKAQLKKLLLGRIAEIATTADDAPDSIRGLLSKFATIGQDNDSSTTTIGDAASFERLCMNNFHATETEAKEAYKYLVSRQRDSKFSKSLVNQLSLQPLHEKSLGRQLGGNSTICDHLEDDLTDANRHKVEPSSNSAQDFSTNLALLDQCTGLQHSGLLFQQSGVTPKRDTSFHPSMALKKGGALEHQCNDEIDTSRYPENMNTDSSSTAAIQLKSTRMNLKAETTRIYSNSDKHSAILSDEEASLIKQTPSFDKKSKIIAVKDKPLQMRKIALPSVLLVEQETRESSVLKKKPVGDAITDDPSQLVLVPDIASRRQKLLESMRAAKEKEARAIRELPENKAERTIACRESHRKLQRISNETSSFDANGFRIDCQGDAASCENKPDTLRVNFTPTNDDESKGRHLKRVHEEVTVGAAGRSSADEPITEFLGDSVQYPSLPLASRREGRKVGVTATTTDRKAWENVPKVIKSNFVLDSFQGRSVDGLKNELFDNVATCPAFSQACGQEASEFFHKDLDNSTPLLILGADIVARREKLRQSVRLQEKESSFKLDSSEKKSSQAVSNSEQEARERVLKSLKEKGPLNASRRSSADGFKPELQIDTTSYQIAATTDQETQGEDFLGFLEDKYSFGSSRRDLNEGLKRGNESMACHGRLPKASGINFPYFILLPIE